MLLQIYYHTISRYDESLDCMAFYNDSVSNFILIKKFKMIIRWYSFLRNPKRMFSFRKWLSDKWIVGKYVFNSIIKKQSVI